MGGEELSSGGPLIEPLTRRERDVLALLVQGHSAPEIAAKLTLAVSSVKWYIQQLYGKLGVNSKRQAITRAGELGLVAMPAGALPEAPLAPPATFAPAQPENKHNLPLQVTRFFGREKEIASLKQRLAEHRLVTLTGSGGVGKTRLSLQTAAEALMDFADGVCLVELAAMTDPALLQHHVATALGVREEPGRPVLESMQSYLRDRKLLLVLDNCEHLLEACAQLVEALLRNSPGLKVLASSREPLSVLGEAVFGVRSLPFPDPAHLPPLEQLSDYPAIRLFVDRARLVLPDYHVAEHNAAALARICQRLDGIPLAIEMAAARVNVLSAAHLAERLEDSFRVLTGGSRTALPRQQTLRATIDWSYALLSEPERRLLQRLSVFAGGCTLDAAEIVCADEEEVGPSIGDAEILDLLSSLVSKSMVIADRRPGEDTRYRLLETVRQYAREKLQAADEGERLRGRHLRFFARLADEGQTELRGPDQLVWLDRLETELDNVRAALEYSLTNGTSDEAEAGMRLAVGLGIFWQVRGHWREAHAWLEAALAQPIVPAQSLTRAEALHAAGTLMSGDGTVSRRRSQVDESVQIFRDAGLPGQRSLAYALITQGELAHAMGDFGPKRRLLEESIVLFRNLDDKWGLALALTKLADTLDPLVNYQPRGGSDSPAPLLDLPSAARNDHTQECALYEESLALFRELGDRMAQGMDLGALGHMYFCWGQRSAGQAMFEAVRLIHSQLDNRLGLADVHIHLGRDALAHDELERATTHLEQSLALLRDLHHEPGLALAAFLEAEVARRQGFYVQAVQGISEAMDWCRKSGNGDAIAAVLDGQARIARSQGDSATAHRQHLEALTLRRGAGHPIALAHSFHALALLAAGRIDQSERAARLFGAAQPYEAALYGFWLTLPIWRAEHEHGLTAVRTQLGEALSSKLWAEGAAMTLEQAFAYALES